MISLIKNGSVAIIPAENEAVQNFARVFGSILPRCPIENFAICGSTLSIYYFTLCPLPITLLSASRRFFEGPEIGKLESRTVREFLDVL